MRSNQTYLWEKKEGAGWWPKKVPTEGVGMYIKTVRFRSGAVMALFKVGDKRIWVPNSPQFTKFKEVWNA